MRFDRHKISQAAIAAAFCVALSACQTTNAPTATAVVSPSAAGVEPDIRRILAGGGLDPNAPAAARQQAAQAPAATGVAQGLVPVGPPTAASLAYAQQPGGAPPLAAGATPLTLSGAVVPPPPQAPAIAAAVAAPPAKGRRKGKSFEPIPNLAIVPAPPTQAVPTSPVSTLPLAAANGVGVTPVRVPGLPPGLLQSAPQLPAALTTSIVPAPLVPKVVDITGPSAIRLRNAGGDDNAAKRAEAPVAPAAPEPYIPKIRRF